MLRWEFFSQTLWPLLCRVSLWTTGEFVHFFPCVEYFLCRVISSLKTTLLWFIKAKVTEQTQVLPGEAQKWWSCLWHTCSVLCDLYVMKSALCHWCWKWTKCNFGRFVTTWICPVLRPCLSLFLSSSSGRLCCSSSKFTQQSVHFAALSLCYISYYPVFTHSGFC